MCEQKHNVYKFYSIYKLNGVIHNEFKNFNVTIDI